MLFENLRYPQKLSSDYSELCRVDGTHAFDALLWAYVDRLTWHMSASACMLAQNYWHQWTCSFGSCWHMSTNVQYDMVNDPRTTKNRWNLHVILLKNICQLCVILTNPAIIFCEAATTNTVHYHQVWVTLSLSFSRKEVIKQHGDD